MRQTILLLALPVALAACAPVGGADPGRSPEPRACFLVQQVTSFRADDGRSVYIRTLDDDVFRLETFSCSGLDTNLQIGLDAGLGGSSRLCQGDPARLIARDYTSELQSCPARVGSRLTEAEVEALPARLRP